MVDEEMRNFIQRSMGKNGFEVVGLAGEAEKLRQSKSRREMGILGAVNPETVDGLRAMRICMTPGLTEAQIIELYF